MSPEAIVLIILAVVIIIAAVFFLRCYLLARKAASQQPLSVGFQGRGTVKTNEVKLEVAAYLLRYRFPDDVRIKVDLINLADGSSRNIISTTGRGVKGFSVTQKGAYSFQIEPDADTLWDIECMRADLLERRVAEGW